MKPLRPADHVMSLTWEDRDGRLMKTASCAYCGASVNYCTGEGSPRHAADTRLRELEAKEALAAVDSHNMVPTWDDGFDAANTRLGEEPPGWLVTSYVGVELISRAFTNRKDAEAHASELSKDGTNVLLSEVKVLFVTKVVPVCLTEIELEVKL